MVDYADDVNEITADLVIRFLAEWDGHQRHMPFYLIMHISNLNNLDQLLTLPPLQDVMDTYEVPSVRVYYLALKMVFLIRTGAQINVDPPAPAIENIIDADEEAAAATSYFYNPRRSFQKR